MYRLAAASDPFAGLSSELEKGTSAAGYFGEQLAGTKLRDDNENFAYSLFEILPTDQSAAMMAQMGIPLMPTRDLQFLVAAMALSTPANTMNISLRQEYVRVALAQEMAAQTGDKLNQFHLDGVFDALGKRIKELYNKTASSVSDVFQRLGRDIGKGLKQFGSNVLNLRAALIALGPGYMRYITDFLIITPGTKWLFGDLFLEAGTAITEGRGLYWLPLAAAGSQTLKDWALALQVVGYVAPPPWNMIAKIASLVMKVGAMVVDWQVTEEIKDLMAQAARANAKSRALYEQQLRDMFGSIAGELEVVGAEQSGEYGSNTVSDPTGESNTGAILLLGGLGLAAVFVVFAFGGK